MTFPENAGEGALVRFAQLLTAGLVLYHRCLPSSLSFCAPRASCCADEVKIVAVNVDFTVLVLVECSWEWDSA